MSSRPRGMSVIEMLVACAVVSLLFSMIVGVLVPAMTMQGQGAARAAVQQEAAVVMARISDDMQDTAVAGIGLLPPSGNNPTGLGIDRIVGVDATGTEARQDWAQEAVCYFYYPTENKVVRKVYAPPGPPAISSVFSPDRPVSLTQAELLTIANSTLGTETLLATNVAEFEITPANPGPSPYKVRIKLSRPVPHTRVPEIFELCREVAVRNTF